MANQIRKVAIVGRHDDPRVAEPMTVLVPHLTKSGIEVLAAEELDLDLPLTLMSVDELAGAADLMIAIGGDGTMLYAGNLSRTADIPLLGINRGRLGFLADVSPDDMLESVDHILAGNYTSEARLLLRAELQRPDGSVARATSINDVVVQRPATGRMVDIVTRIAGNYVNTHSGDGLIIATPTGSTAYALSCGGPIIEPQLEAIVVVPVCPHTLTDRPIVIPASQSIEISILEREGTGAEVTADGQAIGEIRPQDLLTIGAAESRMRLIHPPGYDYFEILRNKLFWGRDSRNRDQHDIREC